MFKAGIKYKTDKITHHGYNRFYDYFLFPFRHLKFNFLEIGIDDGRSIKTWLDYLPNAKIYGVDVLNKSHLNINNSRYEMIIGDQNNDNDLVNIKNVINNSLFIIDDGSHVPEHQLKSFNYLFSNLLDFGGIYIIEDIETSYWKRGKLYGYDINAGIDEKNNIVKIFTDLVNIVNREFLTKDEKKELINNSVISYECIKYISFIMFGYNCIIIKKMSKEEYAKFGKRKYRFEEYIN